MTTIKLNVGGKFVETKKTTLTQSRYFLSLLDDKFGDKREDGTYFIDEDPDLFIHILNKLRHPKYEFPEKQLTNLIKLAEFYVIPMIQTKQRTMTAKQIIFNTEKILDTMIQTNGIIKIKSMDFNKNHKCLYFYNDDNCILIIDTKIKGIMNKKIIRNYRTNLDGVHYILSDETIKKINEYQFNTVMVEINDPIKKCYCMVEYEEYN